MLTYRQRMCLRRMEQALNRSDPHLVAMLTIFARLTAPERIRSVEQLPRPAARAWRPLARLACLIVALLVAVAAAVRRGGHRGAAAVARPVRAAAGRLAAQRDTIPSVADRARPDS
jgi:hypothetical protein